MSSASKSPSSSSAFDVDALLESAGGFGRFQWLVCALIFVPAGLTGAVTLASVFTAANPLHRCRVPACDSQDSTYQDAFVNDYANFTIPLMFSSLNVTSECSASGFDDVLTVDCNDGWVYDDQHYSSSIVTEWDLTCDDEWKSPLLQSVFFAGVFVATVSFGQLANMVGRRWAIVVALVLTAAAEAASALATSYEMLVAFQFFAAFGQCGVFQTAFILPVELVGLRQRVFCGIVIEYFFVLGELYLTLVSVLLRDWRPILWAITAPVVVCAVYAPFLPESPRWLLQKNRVDQAEKEISRMARWNGRKLDKAFHEYRVESAPSSPCASPSPSVPSESLLSVLRSRVMLPRALNLYYGWVVVTMTYYGLSLSSQSLAGDPYLNFFLVALVEIPGYTFAYVGLERVGRRLTMFLSLIVAGVACLAGLMEHIPALHTTAFLLGKMGITSAFGALFLFTSELYPTSVRSIGVGTSSMFGRLGAILSPYVGQSGSASGVSWLPMAIFASNALLGAALTLFLPETRGKALPETIADAETFFERKKTKAEKAEEAESQVAV